VLRQGKSASCEAAKSACLACFSVCFMFVEPVKSKKYFAHYLT